MNVAATDHPVAPELAIDSTPSVREAGLWSGAAMVVAAVHIGAAFAFTALAAPPPPTAIEEALEVDLTPFIVTTPEAVESETITEETPEDLVEEQTEETAETEIAEATPTETPEIVEDQPIETETAEAETEPEQAVQPEPEVAEEIEEQPVEPETIEPLDQVETPIVPEAEVVLPTPRPVAKAKPVEKPKVVKKPAPKQRVARANPAPKSTASVKSTAARAPRVSPARWYSQVQAAIARRRPKSLGESGTARVRFVVSSSGAVSSIGLARSSGSARLDRAALAMVRGARIPAPPDGVTGSRHPFTIPVRFN